MHHRILQLTSAATRKGIASVGRRSTRVADPMMVSRAERAAFRRGSPSSLMCLKGPRSTCQRGCASQRGLGRQGRGTPQVGRPHLDYEVPVLHGVEQKHTHDTFLRVAGKARH